MNKRPFLNEFDYPLDQVQRAWVRIPSTIVLSLFVAVPGVVLGSAVIGLFEGFIKGCKDYWNNFAVPCWRGPK